LYLDIDDTIKVTGRALEAIKATLVEEATPVSGMPRLYAAITDIIDPAWIYLTGSPWQLYEMLHGFIHSHFSASTGPIFTQNLTYTGVKGLLEFLAEGTSLDYKTGRMDDIHRWYPEKMYLGIGDSSGNDPEAYAYA
jgi:phosphatidate phosphatase APP1